MTFDDIDRGSFTSKRKLCSFRITGARCTIWHFSRTCKSTLRVEYEDYIAASSVLALPHLLSKWILKLSLYIGCAKSQNLAGLREIAKINTRKIIGTPNRKILYSQIIVTLRYLSFIPPRRVLLNKFFEPFKMQCTVPTANTEENLSLATVTAGHLRSHEVLDKMKKKKVNHGK